jgi:cell division protease FtsH
MAQALMKYETIDTEQINDIMAGRMPRPPRDWRDDEPKSGSGNLAGSPSDDKGDNPIGDPAGSH